MTNWFLAAAVCTGLAFATFGFLEVARHLQWRKYRDSGYVPSTQHWCMIATLVAALLLGGAVLCLVMWAARG